MNDIIEAYQSRRSVYALGNKITTSNNEIMAILKECIKQAPTAFNSQSGRIILLLGKEHKKLWELILIELAKVTPAEKFTVTELKIASFAEAYGTILFFEDNDIIENLKEYYPLYKDAFYAYSCQSSGMLQYMVWTALSSINIGASLQHYNPLIDEVVKQKLNLPESWKMMSQMPFGQIKQKATPKDILPIDSRFKVFN